LTISTPGNELPHVGDNPVNYIDPTGTDFWSCVGGIIGGVRDAITGKGGGAGSFIGAGAFLTVYGIGWLGASEGLTGLGAALVGLTGIGAIVVGGLLLTADAVEIANQCR
jgi:hypothetical protein